MTQLVREVTVDPGDTKQSLIDVLDEVKFRNDNGVLLVQHEVMPASKPTKVILTFDDS